MLPGESKAVPGKSMETTVIQCARRTSSWQGAQAACIDFGIALAYAQSNTLVFTRALASVWQSGHGRSTGLTTSSGEHYQVQCMARRSSLQARRWSGNPAMGEALALPCRRANIIECKAWKDKVPFKHGVGLAIWPWAKHWPHYVVGRTSSSARHGKTRLPLSKALAWQSGHGRSTGLTVLSGEHHRV